MTIAHCAADYCAAWAADPTRRPWRRCCIDLLKGASNAADDVGMANRALQIGNYPGPGAGAGKESRPAATLAAVALTPGASGSMQVHWVTYGDAGILKLSWDSKGWTWISPQPKPSTNVTEALPGSPERGRCGEAKLGRSDVLVLATDGVWPAIDEQPDQFVTGIVQAWSGTVSAAKFATLLDFEIPGYGDDRTIVLARPLPPGQ